jgi:aspartate kinase
MELLSGYPTFMKLKQRSFMIVYKFGGASVKDASGVRNLSEIVSDVNGKLVIVVSAFGKTTNALEITLKQWISGDKNYRDQLENIYAYHASVVTDLFPGENSPRGTIDISFSKLREYLKSHTGKDYDFEYDQIVSYGEIWSTVIVASYLRSKNIKAEWIDIRENLITDDSYRDANILWNESQARVVGVFNFIGSDIYVTQGFIGGTVTGQTTTLGREGSDYTAAILANMLDSEEVVVWKDVPGMLNADPKWLQEAKKLEEVSYREAVEMSFSGAKIIHPKTIKPLHNKGIPLRIKSFISPSEKGTLVKSDVKIREPLSVFIRKENQMLLSILPRDLSFAMGDMLGRIFHLFAKHGIKVNLVEASAISLNVCVDNDKHRVESLTDELKGEFSTIYNENLEILSIRHYTPEAVNQIIEGREILLEQRTRNTVRFVVRNL